MINLAFEIAETFIAYYALSGTRKDFFVKKEIDEEIGALQDDARAINKETSLIIKGGYLDINAMQSKIEDKELSSQLQRIDSLLQELQKSPAYKKLLHDTSQSVVQLRSDWEASLPSMHEVSDFLLDGRRQTELKVFVSLPTPNLDLVRYGDIYIINDTSTATANSINLWHMAATSLIQPQEVDTPQAETDQEWLCELLRDLCFCEIESRINKKVSHKLTHSDDPTYKKDFETLLPLFRKYMASSQTKKLSTFRKEAATALLSRRDKNRHSTR